MARPKEFDPGTALAAAVDVFWRDGYDRASLDALMAGMQVGRQSLYDTFGDKRELYLRALARYRDDTQAAMRRLFASGQPVRNCFAALLFGIVDESRADHERGCLLLDANIERNRNDREVAALVKKNQAECEAIFADALASAQRSGELGAGKDPRALASFFVAAIQGMRSTARAASDRTALARTARVALAALD